MGIAISDKTRKYLWGKSGGRCALCSAELVREAGGAGNHSVVGEECHIRSGRPPGPRHDPGLPRAEVDAYDNLILLSPGCHKMVDDSPGEYPPERLRQARIDHEERIRLSTAIPVSGTPTGPDQCAPEGWAIRMLTGQDILDALAGCGALDLAPEGALAGDDVDLVASFLEEVEGYGELLGELTSGDRVRAAASLSSQVRELDANGWLVFGCASQRWIGSPEHGFTIQCALIRVVRADSPRITTPSLPSDRGDGCAPADDEPEDE